MSDARIRAIREYREAVQEFSRVVATKGGPELRLRSLMRLYHAQAELNAASSREGVD